MAAPLAFPLDEHAAHGTCTRSRSSDSIGTEERQLLTTLRIAALECRCAAWTDLFEACAVLSVDRNRQQWAVADVLVRCLSQILGQRPKFNRPGVWELSFDEHWLMRMVSSCREADRDSFDFLMRSRVPAHARRNLGFLITAVSEPNTQN